jgi:hypothetical protein
MSLLVLKKRFKLLHYLGAALIVGGIAMSITAVSDDHGTSVSWGAVFFLSNIPIAVSSVMKEMIMSPVYTNAVSGFNLLFFFFYIFNSSSNEMLLTWHCVLRLRVAR